MKINLKLSLLISITYSLATQAQPCDSASFELIATGDTGDSPNTNAYSPLVSNNLFLASANENGNNISLFSVDTSDGALTSLGNVPTVPQPVSLSFSPLFNGKEYLAVVSFTPGEPVTTYQVNTLTGALTPTPGSFPIVPGEASAVTYSPIVSSNLFAAVTDESSNEVHVYSVDPATGNLSEIGASPFSTGTAPLDVAYSPLITSNGKLFAAVGNNVSNNVSVFSVNTTTGAFSLVGTVGAGVGAGAVSFSPVIGTNLFALVCNSASVSVYQVDINTGVFSPIGTVTSGISTPLDGAGFTPLIGGNLFAVIMNEGNNTMGLYSVDTTTGAFTFLNTIATGINPGNAAFSPIIAGNLFAAVPNFNSNSISEYQLEALIPVIITPSQAVQCGGSVTITATIGTGEAPFTIVWSDGLIQTTSNTTVTRVVTPSATSQYQIISVTDAAGCTAGPSNTITVTVITGPCCN